MITDLSCRVIRPDEDLDKEDIPINSTETERKASSQKAVSKSARAKKLLNKKIKINQHIKFDEDGEPVEQVISSGKVDYPDKEERQSSSSDSDVDEVSVQPVSIDEYERSKKPLKVGGIRIGEAKELLRSRDKMDRKRERVRIRAAHRQRRLKIRQRSKDEEEGEGAMREGVRLVEALASEKEGEREEDGGETSDLEEVNERQPRLYLNEEDKEMASSDEERPKPKKQKLNRKERKKKKERKHKQLGTEPEPPSVFDDEELALHLLMS